MANPEHIEWLLAGKENWNARRERNNFLPDLSGEDIYGKFREAGKLDEDGYIPLVGMNLSKANFCKSILSTPFEICSADLRQANLWSADFRDAALANSKLSGANLAGARFDDANMLGVSLAGSDTKMASTTFSGTELFEADLRNTNFANAYLGKAQLACSKIAGADLRNATLTGADLAHSQPWKAKLFVEKNARRRRSRRGRIRSVARLIEKCRQLGAVDAGQTLYFRGERRAKWELRPSVMRCGLRAGKFTLREKEGEMLVDLMSRRPEDFGTTASALDQLVLAQHHQLKTRLLDISRNPLIALFWACERASDADAESGRMHVFSVPKSLIKPFNSDTVSVLTNFAKLPLGEQNVLLGSTWDDLKRQGHCIDNLREGTTQAAMNALYGAIRQEKPHFRKEIDPRLFFQVFVVEPQQSFQRIRAQSGAFLISAFHERFERREILKWNSGIPVYDHYTFEVAMEDKEKILGELRLLNITRDTLLPGLDQAAQTVTEFHSR